MNKRDYFASQAMQAIIAKAPLTLLFAGDTNEEIEMLRNAVAAYGYADAMLEARKEWH